MTNTPVPQEPTARVAIVATVWEATDLLPGFIAHHQSAGFAHLYLFAGQPNDPALAAYRDQPWITLIPADAKLQQALKDLPSFSRLSPQATQIFAREILHAEWALRLALKDGYDWLLHIAPDELFYGPYQWVPTMFGTLSDNAIDQAYFLNDEALPLSSGAVDAFGRVTLLFKRNPYLVTSLLQGSAADYWQSQGLDYFVEYIQGRAAVRVTADRFAKDPYSFGTTGGTLKEATIHDARILHFCHSSFGRLHAEYTRLGAFPDTFEPGGWMTTGFQRTIRDCLQRGDLATARDLYDKAVRLDRPGGVDSLLSSGLGRRVALGPIPVTTP